MTYFGGVEDGKTSLASQVLRIIEVNTSASAQERLDQIHTLCIIFKKEPTKEHNAKDTTSTK